MVPEKSARGWEVLTIFFYYLFIESSSDFTERHTDLPREAIETEGGGGGGGVPVFLRKPIATSDFHRDGSRPLSPPLDTPMKCARIAILSSRNKVLSK